MDLHLEWVLLSRNPGLRFPNKDNFIQRVEPHVESEYSKVIIQLKQSISIPFNEYAACSNKIGSKLKILEGCMSSKVKRGVHGGLFALGGDPCL